MLISLLPAPIGSKRPPPAAAGRDTDEDTAPSKVTAVVVEDDFLSLMEAENVARDAGLDVVGTAINANEAISLIETFRPDLVLMDINLGSDKDGVDVALEANKRFGIRCLFTTAYSDDVLKRRAAPSDPLGWVIKPFSSDTLRKAITDAMDQLDFRN